MTLGRNLRRLRLERGFKQDELAKAARSSQQTISELETGHRKGAQTRTLEKLAGALGVSVGAFFADGDGSTPPVPPRPRTPKVDETEVRFDKRFAATDVSNAKQLQETVGAEFDAIRSYTKLLKAAGVGEDNFRLRLARRHQAEAKRRLYAITSRATDLAINAEFGGDREIHDTVAEYVGRAEEADAYHGAEEARSRAHPEAG
jgi:transcriptional regulator with XRE-family HTH domain